MTRDPMAPYFPAFMISWIALGIASWIWIWTRRSAEEKRVWHRRIGIAAGVIFGAFITFTLLAWHQPFGLLIFLPALVLIIWLNLRFTTFCRHCNRMVYNYFWWRRTRFCPYCGTELARPI
jgi:hypothetical protein